MALKEMAKEQAEGKKLAKNQTEGKHGTYRGYTRQLVKSYLEKYGEVKFELGYRTDKDECIKIVKEVTPKMFEIVKKTPWNGVYATDDLKYHVLHSEEITQWDFYCAITDAITKVVMGRWNHFDYKYGTTMPEYIQWYVKGEMRDAGMM